MAFSRWTLRLYSWVEIRFSLRSRELAGQLGSLEVESDLVGRKSDQASIVFELPTVAFSHEGVGVDPIEQDAVVAVQALQAPLEANIEEDVVDLTDSLGLRDPVGGQKSRTPVVEELMA